MSQQCTRFELFTIHCIISVCADFGLIHSVSVILVTVFLFTGYPVPELTWYKDDMELDRYCGLPKYEIFRNGKMHSLHIYKYVDRHCLSLLFSPVDSNVDISNLTFTFIKN